MSAFVSHNFAPDPEVDRIARIIADAIDGHGYMFDDPWPWSSNHWTNGYREAAKAVLATIKEGTA